MHLSGFTSLYFRVNSAAQEESNAAGTPKNMEITFLNGSKLNSEFIEMPVVQCGESQRNKSTLLLFQQFYAMLIKKFTYVWRRKDLLIGQTLIPMTYLSVVLIGKYFNFTKQKIDSFIMFGKIFNSY